jgi:DNA-binding PadR family transcriptional regulator
MNAKITRDLTTLEYIILGLLGTSPQSGYSIMGTLETGVHRWKAGAGAIYPALKRLERHEIISSKLEVVNETRSRKIYSLTPEGEELLDHWLKEPPSPGRAPDEFDLLLVKFLLGEPRLTREEVLALLDTNEKHMRNDDDQLRVLVGLAISIFSPHQILMYEATMMDRIMRYQWIKRARRRIIAGDTTLSESAQDLISALENPDPS